MPTYVYACSTCDKTFEMEQRIVEDALKVCLCGKEGAVKRVIQPVGIAFKGSGFYVNDSGKTAAPVSKTETASESTPAAAPEAAPATPAATTPAPSVEP